MVTTTASVSSSSPDVRTQVRDQVSRARQSLATNAMTMPSAVVGEDQRDFVRHYLRFLSTQAVGKFTHALARLASGLDVLGRRTTETQSNLARTEQDVLHLAAAFETVRELPPLVAELAARVARAEAQLGVLRHTPPDTTVQHFIRVATRHLHDTARPVSRGCHVALGPVPTGWLAAVNGLGFETAECSREQLADRAPESADLITTLCTFDTMSLSDAHRAVEDSRRVLRPAGTLVVVFETLSAGNRPAWLTDLHPRVSEPGRLTTLASECGFDRVVERSLDDGWPAFHVMLAHRV